jgi:hypothetical protein
MADATQDTGSSPEELLPVEADPAEPKDAVLADPSSAEGMGDKDLLATVTEALKAKEPPPSSPEQDVAADPAAPQLTPEARAKAEEILGEITDEELRKYGPRTQKRIQQLLTERGQARDQLEQIRPKAESFERIDNFVKQNRLTPQDVDVILEIGALMRNDPFAAVKRLEPIMHQLWQITGQVLPPDLQERVRLGYLAEQDAQELVRARNQASLLQGQTREQAEKTERDTRERQVFELVSVTRKAANEWDAARRTSDPDWSLKHTRVAEKLKLSIMEEGYPGSAQAAVERLDKILTTVNQEFTALRPRPQEVRPVRGGASPLASTEPKTAFEAAQRALARH